MAAARLEERELWGLLAMTDEPLRLCRVREHEALTQDIEFRTRLVYELCRQNFDRLPGREGLLNLLALELREQVTEGGIAGLAGAERLAVLEDLVMVADELDLWAHAEWIALLLDVALDVAQLELALGHLDRARTTAERVHRHAPGSSAIWQKALAVLCHHAHLVGDAQREDALLLEWESVAPAARSPEAAIRRARRDIRAGHPDAALDALRAALTRSDPLHPAIAVECSRAARYAGRAGDALGGLDTLDQRRVREEPALHAAADHARYMALHDLDLNESAALLSEACVRRFAEIGAMEEEVLCRVNLGDAVWGAGDVPRARRTLVEARALAEECELPHASNVARVCLANVVAPEDPDRALELYDARSRTLPAAVGDGMRSTAGSTGRSCLRSGRGATAARCDSTRARPSALATGTSSPSHSASP